MCYFVRRITQFPTKIVLSLSPQFLAKQLNEQPATSNCTNESTVMPAVLSIFLVFFTLVLFFLTFFLQREILETRLKFYTDNLKYFTGAKSS